MRGVDRTISFSFVMRGEIVPSSKLIVNNTFPQVSV